MGFEILRNLQDVFWEYQNFRDFFFLSKKSVHLSFQMEEMFNDFFSF